MAGHAEQLKSMYADAAANRGLDRLRFLLNHPRVLVADSSARRVLALTPAIAIPYSSALLDVDVGGRGRGHFSVAQRGLVYEPRELDSGGRTILRGRHSL